MDFLKLLAEGIVEAAEELEKTTQEEHKKGCAAEIDANRRLSDKEKDIAKQFDELFSELKPGHPLRLEICKIAQRLEPTALKSTPDYRAKFRVEDFNDRDFQFVLAEAKSLDINVEICHEAIWIKAGLDKGTLPCDKTTRAKVLATIKDYIKSQRLNVARKSKLNDAIARLNNLNKGWQEELAKSWRIEGVHGDEAVIYNEYDWAAFNVLCQIFRILGGRVTHYLNDYREFQLSFGYKDGHDGYYKVNWTFPYSLRSLGKFRDIVDMLILFHDIKEDNLLINSSAGARLNERVARNGWVVALASNEMRVSAGITKQRFNGLGTGYREVKLFTMPYSLSDVVPFLELLWQVELGEVCAFSVENNILNVLSRVNYEITYDAKFAQ